MRGDGGNLGAGHDAWRGGVRRDAVCERLEGCSGRAVGCAGFLTRQGREGNLQKVDPGRSRAR
jgi:hypothetical protein